MEIKQLFSETVKKMKRYDFLSDFVRRKSDEKSKMAEEAAALRKKNGRGNEFDLAIFQLNAKISDIDKSIDKCKSEMKTLRGLISSGLRECYAKSDSLDFTRRVTLAHNHIFGDKSSLVTLNEVGGIFGESKIVGAVVTHDKKKKCAVKECVCAGEKNRAGRITAKPEIIVWDYDESKTEGEFRIEDDAFKQVLKRRKTCELAVFLKDAYKKPILAVSLAVSALVVLLFGLSAAAGLTRNALTEGFYVIFSIGAAIFAVFAIVSAAKSEIGSPVDGVALAAFAIGLFTGGISFAKSGDFGAAIPSAFLVLCAVALFVTRFVLRKRKTSGSVNYGVVLSAAGVYAALLISKADLSGAFAKTVIAVAYFVSAWAGLVLTICSVIFERKDVEKAGAYLALFGLAFSLAAIVFAGDVTGKIVSASCSALSAAAYLYLRLKNEKV